VEQGQKLCPMCTRYTDQVEPICGHCGYNFETGRPGERAEIPTISDQPEESEEEEPSEDVYLPELPPSRSRAGLRTIVALLVIIGLAAPLLLALPIREALDAFQDVGAPRAAAPDDDDGPPDKASRRYCVSRLTFFLDVLLAEGGQAEEPIQSIMLDAAAELGVDSFEYDTLIRLYGEEGLLFLAATKGTRKATRRAHRLIRKECRREYR
jgi:hypothetical protein